MRKIIFASHHRLASGMKDTLNYIAPNAANVTAIDAYMTNTPVEKEIDDALKTVDLKNDEVLVFTDMMGGSVNQNFIKYISYPHFHIIAGMSLPLVLTIILALPEGFIDPEQLRNSIEEAKEQVFYVNDKAKDMAIDEDDE
ncbi:PTS family mannose fructose sorbose porter component IIA [Ligilactobacillus acidipiscis DSM 15836]|uniref:PTS family mannose fructose sorbose porter component IIA n=1 Tax=Ligilactobacillus acidipiscis DSM 15836 TaxID=1423716 RepID=A0ABR5PHN9_9LACO|nr:PTS N-acetylglucosamine transporter subunit IIBC [Ligilactobacillus acidipiscis]KRM22585.1 PTS family mannose fructose sorbose porter component IIA [Ligilactobacillus acidipiscis DSM 15836]GAW64036.1 mannose/fructose-specific PTS system IIA component [Ligilactobacillus acidipiscis]GEN21874.1 PTS N-acetylglucosamine transporter subunit IIBC [Ligilactobacillus acidipiscis]